MLHIMGVRNIMGATTACIVDVTSRYRVAITAIKKDVKNPFNKINKNAGMTKRNSIKDMY